MLSDGDCSNPQRSNLGWVDRVFGQQHADVFVRLALQVPSLFRDVATEMATRSQSSFRLSTKEQRQLVHDELNHILKSAFSGQQLRDVVAELQAGDDEDENDSVSGGGGGGMVSKQTLFSAHEGSYRTLSYPL